MDRRNFIAALGAGTAFAIAGCSGDDGGSNVDTSSPEAVVESFYKVSDDLDQDSSSDEILDAWEPMLHSASPYTEFIEEMDDEDTGTGTETEEQQNLESVETEVTKEDLSAEELSARPGFFDMSEEELNAIAAENAVVSATVKYEDIDTQEREHVTATEDGDWLIVT